MALHPLMVRPERTDRPIFAGSRNHFAMPARARQRARKRKQRQLTRALCRVEVARGPAEPPSEPMTTRKRARSAASKPRELAVLLARGLQRLAARRGMLEHPATAWP